MRIQKEDEDERCIAGEKGEEQMNPAVGISG